MKGKEIVFSLLAVLAYSGNNVAMAQKATKNAFEKMPKPLPETLTFKKAFKNVARRQEYLDQLQPKMNEPAVKRLIYYNSPKPIIDENPASTANLPLLGAEELSEVEVQARNSYGFMAFLSKVTLGRIKSSNIYVFPEAFFLGENVFLARLEAAKQAAANNRHGIRIGNTCIDYSNYMDYTPDLAMMMTGAQSFAITIRKLDELNALISEIDTHAREFMKLHNFIRSIKIANGNLDKHDSRLFDSYMESVYKPTEKILDGYAALIKGHVRI